MSSSGCNRFFTEYALNDGTGNHRALAGACTPDNQVNAYYVKYTGKPGPYPSCCGGMWLSTPALSTYPSFDPWQWGWSFEPQFFG